MHGRIRFGTVSVVSVWSAYGIVGHHGAGIETDAIRPWLGQVEVGFLAAAPSNCVVCKITVVSNHGSSPFMPVVSSFIPSSRTVSVDRADDGARFQARSDNGVMCGCSGGCGSLVCERNRCLAASRDAGRADAICPKTCGIEDGRCDLCRCESMGCKVHCFSFKVYA